MIITELYLNEIKKILLEFPSLTLKLGENVLIVDDPYRWACENHVNGIQQDDIAFASRSKGIIILKKQITEEKKHSIFRRIEHKISFQDNLPKSFTPVQIRLNTNKKFIIHTTYHEIGHYQGILQKEETLADIFALECMGYRVKQLP